MSYFITLSIFHALEKKTLLLSAPFKRRIYTRIYLVSLCEAAIRRAERRSLIAAVFLPSRGFIGATQRSQT